MKALVVGGNGFIGSHLVDRLAEMGWEVSILDLRNRLYEPLPQGVRYIPGDLTQSHVVRQALNGVEVVFHLAWTTIHEVSNRDPEEDVRSNLIPSIQLIDTCRQACVSRFVFVSSGGTVYGPAAEIPIREASPQNPISAYGITKLAVEKYLQLFHHLHGMDYVILRPSVPFGPRQNPLGRQGVAPVFLYRVGNGLPITIFGDGSVTRDYFYISDLIEALAAAAACPLADQRVFNVGGGAEISLMQILEWVEATVGKKAVVDFQPARKFDVPRLLLDIRLAKEELGWQPQVSMKDGLAQTWSWISSHTFEEEPSFPVGLDLKLSRSNQP